MAELTDKLVGAGEKPELSPNPDGSAFVKQVEVDALTDVVNPEENVLYIVKGVKWKYRKESIVAPGTNTVITHGGWGRVLVDPEFVAKDGGRETPVNVNQAPKERPQVFSNPVAFNEQVLVNGKTLQQFIDERISHEDAGDVNVYEFEEGDNLTDEIWNKLKDGDIIIVYNYPFVISKNDLTTRKVIKGSYDQSATGDRTIVDLLWDTVNNDDDGLLLNTNTLSNIVNQGLVNENVQVKTLEQSEANWEGNLTAPTDLAAGLELNIGYCGAKIINNVLHLVLSFTIENPTETAIHIDRIRFYTDYVPEEYRGKIYDIEGKTLNDTGGGIIRGCVGVKANINSGSPETKFSFCERYSYQLFFGINDYADLAAGATKAYYAEMQLTLI